MSDSRKMIMVGAVVALIFVAVGSIWLSVSAETLDKVAEDFGAEDKALWRPPIPDYEIPGFEGVVPVKILVGIAFTFVVLGAAFLAGRALRVK